MFTLRTSNTASNGGGATTIAVTLTGVQAGDLVVVFCSHHAAQTMTVSDGSPLTALTWRNRSALSGQMFYRLAAPSSGNINYTCTFGASVPGRKIFAYAFAPSGAVTFDSEPTGTGAVLGTAPTSGNMTTTGTDVLAFGAQSNENEVASSLETINGIARTGVIAASNSSLWYLPFNSTFTGAAAATLAGSTWCVCHAAAFKIAATPPPPSTGVNFPRWRSVRR